MSGSNLNIPQGYLRYQGVRPINVDTGNFVDTSGVADSGKLQYIAQACNQDVSALAFTSDGQLYSTVPSQDSSDWLPGQPVDLYVKTDLSNYRPAWGPSRSKIHKFPKFNFTSATTLDDLKLQLDGAWILIHISTSYAVLDETLTSTPPPPHIDHNNIFWLNSISDDPSNRGLATPIQLRYNTTQNGWEMRVFNSDSSTNAAALKYYLGHNHGYDYLATDTEITTDSTTIFSIQSTSGTFKIVSTQNGQELISNGGFQMSINAQSQYNEIIVQPTQARLKSYIQDSRNEGSIDCCSGLAGYSSELQAACVTYNVDPAGSSSQCPNRMNNYCSAGTSGSNVVTLQCKQWCRNNNCDLNISQYCSNVGNAAALQEQMCSCFMPTDFMNTYYGSLTASLPSGLGNLMVKTPYCAYPKCAASPWKYNNFNNPGCQDFNFCFQQQNVNINGTVNGAVGLSANAGCNFNDPRLKGGPAATSTSSLTNTGTGTSNTGGGGGGSGGLSGGAIAGIVIGSIAILGLVGLLVSQARKRKPSPTV